MKKNIRILVSDDESSIRGVVASVLTDDGYQVTAARNGEEALALFTPNPYHIVITDILMGGMSGIELLIKIKELSKDTQVIIMTSHASLDTAIEALRAGAYDYLIKPFDDIKIISMVADRAADRFSLLLENKRLIEGLRQRNEELEKINKELSGLTVQMADQMAEPPVSAAAAPAAGPVVENAEPNRTIFQNIEIIKKETARCKTMIADLLSVKKTGVESTDVGAVIERVCDIVKQRFAQSSIILEKELAPDLPRAFCGENQLEKVILNVLVYVRQSLSGVHGTVKISTRILLSKEAVRTSARALVSKEMEIRIKDTGPGIPPEIQARLFEPFFTTKLDEKGDGLGLSVCLRIIKEYGGNMRVESKPGAGTAYIITLPMAQESVAPPPPDPPSPTTDAVDTQAEAGLEM